VAPKSSASSRIHLQQQGAKAGDKEESEDRQYRASRFGFDLQQATPSFVIV
jgi:hypothetical protein